MDTKWESKQQNSCSKGSKNQRKTNTKPVSLIPIWWSGNQPGERVSHTFLLKSRKICFLINSFYTFVLENHLFSPFLNPVRPDTVFLFQFFAISKQDLLFIHKIPGFACWIGLSFRNRLSVSLRISKHFIDMAKKPTLSFWQIWSMSFGFMGGSDRLFPPKREYFTDPFRSWIRCRTHQLFLAGSSPCRINRSTNHWTFQW